MYELISKRFPRLGFYVNGERYKFYNGKLRTDDSKVVAVAEKLEGVEVVNRPESKKEPEKKSEEKPKKSAPKRKKTAKKSSDK
ncbi:hypothetical protein [Paludifilum halophilum]|uniref:Uncharacterized protein n=1 Tax=Paludifilum halophilum TaxID=1642702 RepID=A0A235B8F2_9BACL|nr:hypothetical protein [Paludifilum halophilum]OYD08541.1 hypothetical protein CHM34_06860 [Paludifilum halophilum]